MNREAAQRNREAYASLPNLSFETADLLQPSSWSPWRPEVIYSSCCLEYLTENETLEFFRIAWQTGVQQMVIYEPTDASAVRTSMPRGGSAFAHDYSCLLAAAGWEHFEIRSDPGSAAQSVLIRARRS